MKELSIEEKAEAYERAIERANELNYVSDKDSLQRKTVEHIFPELKESEDERTWIINYLSNRELNSSIIAEKENLKKAIAWLEKQGKKIKPIEGFNTEFERQISHIIASTINKEYEYTEDSVKRVSNALLNYAKHEFEKQGEQNEIFNVPSREVILSIWDLGNEWKELTNGSISTEYGTQLNYIQKHWKESEYYLRAKQSEQKPTQEIEPTPIFRIGNILKRKGKDYTFRVDRIQGGYYHCDHNNGAFFPIEEQDKWELVEQKAWTEEDKKIISKILGICEDFKRSFDISPASRKIVQKDIDKIDSWLKSLRERYTWKPSDEQIGVIEAVINNRSFQRRHLDLLYEQLKKLREE